MDDMELIEALDRWIEEDIGGVIPADVLRARGVRVIAAGELDEAALHEQLWLLIRAMADIGIYVGFTDRLSDRELYEHITTAILPLETFLAPDDPQFGVDFDCSGEEDVDVEHVYDRDRFLPTMEQRVLAATKVM